MPVLDLLNGDIGLSDGKSSVGEGFMVCVNGRQHWAMITNFVGGSGNLSLSPGLLALLMYGSAQ